MADNDRKVRWPDGASFSLPTPWIGGRVGGTYYWSPGADDAPHLTLTRTTGLPGAGANVVFRRKGMTSSDTLGPGFSANVSMILPSVTLNSTIPAEEDHIPRPWKSRVTTVEAGSGTPNASPAFTTTYTPDQIVSFLSKYVFPPPVVAPKWRESMVRDSAAAAGVPSRNNVFEYGFPGSDQQPPPANETASTDRPAIQSDGGTIGAAGEPPVGYLSRRQQGPLGDGMDKWPASTAQVEPWAPAVPTSPGPGGLYGLVLDYLRDNNSPGR